MTNKKKSLREAACYRELNLNLDEFLKALFDLGYLPNRKTYAETSESDAYCWLENEPSEQEMAKLLEKLGY